VDAAAPQPGDLTLSIPSGQSPSAPLIEQTSTEIPSTLLEELWTTAQAGDIGLTRAEFSAKLVAVGHRHNFGLVKDAAPTGTNISSFLRSLHLADLALAHACALGLEASWERFFALYRAPLTQAAIAITGSATLGHDLADSLHPQLYGLSERKGQRRSPLDSYSGRGSFMGWLRTILAQRHVDHHRQTHRESALETLDIPAPSQPLSPSPATTFKLEIATQNVLRSLSEEDRFLLSCYFLDQQKLHHIAAMLRVHEATVSRKLKRLTGDIRKSLLKNLQTAGLSKQAAEEALGTDPRDLSINLRKLLQYSRPQPFSDETQPSGLKP
jgi:RNA polymerase sigma-70 factor, ECF subfamily